MGVCVYARARVQTSEINNLHARTAAAAAAARQFARAFACVLFVQLFNEKSIACGAHDIFARMNARQRWQRARACMRLPSALT